MHTLTIDKLLDQYEKDAEQVKFEFLAERKRIIDDQNLSMTELQDIIYNMEKTFLDTETAAEQNFQANMEELRDRVRRHFDEKTTDDFLCSNEKISNNINRMWRIVRKRFKMK